MSSQEGHTPERRDSHLRARDLTLHFCLFCTNVAQLISLALSEGNFWRWAGAWQCQDPIKSIPPLQVTEEVCFQEKEGSITFPSLSCQEEGAPSWSNPWPPTAPEQHQLLPTSLIIPPIVTEVGLLPSCLGLQHPRCTGRRLPQYCQTKLYTTAVPGQHPLPAGPRPPHSQQDQWRGELEEIFVGQRNWFRWDLLGAPRREIPERSELNLICS